jgi:hypothetical protein
VSHRETICVTELGTISQVSPQHLPRMNERCWVHLPIDHLFLLVFREEEKMGKFLFDLVVVVDWYVHENAAVKAEWAFLFWCCEDVCPHDFGGTLRLPLSSLSRMKKYLHLMCFVHLELEKEPLTSKCIVDWLS